MAYCPRCQQPLPDPPERFCPHCGADLEMTPPLGADVPPPGVPPAGMAGTLPGSVSPGIPWEQRDRIGFAAALVETVQQVFKAPVRFFQAMPVTGGMGGPLLYGVIVGYVGSAIGAIYAAILGALMGSTFSFGRNAELERLMPFVEGATGLIIRLVLGPIFMVIQIFVVSAVVHVMLLALSGARRGFEASFRVVAYSSTALLLQVIPFCGGLAAFVYCIVLSILGLSEAHQISRGKAAAAVLLPIVLICCCCALGIGAMAGGIASFVNRAR